MTKSGRLLALTLTTALGCAAFASLSASPAAAQSSARTYLPDSPYALRRQQAGTTATATRRRLPNPQILYQDAPTGTLGIDPNGVVTNNATVSAPLPSAPLEISPVAPLYPGRVLGTAAASPFAPAQTIPQPVLTAPTETIARIPDSLEELVEATEPGLEALDSPALFWDETPEFVSAEPPLVQDEIIPLPAPSFSSASLDLPPPPSVPQTYQDEFAALTGTPARPIVNLEPFAPAAPAAVAPPVVNLDISAAPAATTPEPLRSTSNGLSRESRKLIANIPAQLTPTPPKKAKTVQVRRIDPDVANILQASSNSNVESSSASVGVRVKRPSFNVNYELEKAYNAVLAGNTESAIEIYKEALSIAPRNRTGLFGLATTYHRIGSLDNARALYARLLEIDPDNKEGLSNFLALIGEEAPEEALPELQVLASKHPNFSPILAQLGSLYQQLGDYPNAREYMLRAVRLTPENMTYRYNLAIILDQQGAYAEAANAYRYLIGVSERGVIIPASTDTLQARLTYILSELS